jgi:hypothetical protein
MAFPLLSLLSLGAAERTASSLAAEGKGAARAPGDRDAG